MCDAFGDSKWPILSDDGRNIDIYLHRNDSQGRMVRTMLLHLDLVSLRNEHQDGTNDESN